MLSKFIWNYKKYIFFTLALLFLLVSRFSFLDLRPAHFDEGINGWFVNKMYEVKYYDYDPRNYHGPLHFYILQMFETLFGSDISVHRAVTATFGSFLVLLVWQFSKVLGPSAVIASISLIFSTGYLYYSRYSIHEIPFAFFFALSLWGILLWQKKEEKLGVWYFVFGSTMAFCLKETAILHFLAIMLALLIVEVVLRRKKQALDSLKLPSWEFWKQPLTLSLFLWSLMFSGFFQDTAGLKDFFYAFMFWQKTGLDTGGGHEKSFWYWLELMRLYEPLIAVGFLFSIYKLKAIQKRSDFIYLYGVIVWLFFSVIPYKTPWNAYSFYWVFALGFGCLCIKLWQNQKKYRLPLIVVLSFLIGYQLNSLVAVNYIMYEHPKNKLAYVHTRKDLMDSLEPLFHFVEKNPEYYYLKIGVYTSSYWPLPFLLEDFRKVVYSSKEIPDEVEEDVILINSKDSTKLEAKLKYLYYYRDLKFREAQELSRIYYKRDFFELSQQKDFQLTE